MALVVCMVKGVRSAWSTYASIYEHLLDLWFVLPAQWHEHCSASLKIGDLKVVCLNLSRGCLPWLIRHCLVSEDLHNQA